MYIWRMNHVINKNVDKSKKRVIKYLKGSSSIIINPKSVINKLLITISYPEFKSQLTNISRRKWNKLIKANKCNMITLNSKILLYNIRLLYIYTYISVYTLLGKLIWGKIINIR